MNTPRKSDPNGSDQPGTVDITATLAERGKRYGKFTEHARITWALKPPIAASSMGIRTS